MLEFIKKPMSSNKRETEKVIDYRGERIKIRKFDALTGGYIAQKMLTSLLPAQFESSLGIQRNQTPSRSMTKEEFAELQTDCMSCVTCLKPELKAEASILHENGTVGIPGFGFEDVFLLTLEVLKFNMLGFFSEEYLQLIENMLADLVQKLSTLLPKTAEQTPNP